MQICKYLCVVHQFEYASLMINHAVFYNCYQTHCYRCMYNAALSQNRNSTLKAFRYATLWKHPETIQI